MFVTDIETVPNLEMIDFLPEIKPPGNMSKPETIAKWISENLASAQKEQYDRMALDMCLAKIRAIGIKDLDTGEKLIWTVNNVEQEIYALQRFWQTHFEHRGQIVGFNILAFDLPILLWRSMMLDEVRPKLVIGGRYDKDIIDLYDLLTLRNNRLGSMAGLGLKPVCKMLGIPNPLPEVEGSQVEDMSDEEVVAYLGNDLDMTEALFWRMGGGYHRYIYQEEDEIPF